jgi:hypothetical protein
LESPEKSIIETAAEQVQLARAHAEAAAKSMNEAAASALASAKSAEAAAALNPAAKAGAQKKGKPLRNYIADFDYYSGKASEISRSLGLGGIAIIWIFRNPDEKSLALLQKPLLPRELLYPLGCLVISLLLDLLQYVIGYSLWRKFYNDKLAELDDEDAILEAPDSYARTLRVFFWLKMVFMLLSYVLIFIFLSNKIIAYP